MKTFYGFPIPTPDDVVETFGSPVKGFTRAVVLFTVIWLGALFVQQSAGQTNGLFGSILSVVLIGSGVLAGLSLLLTIIVTFFSTREDSASKKWLNGGAYILNSQAGNTIIPLLISQEVSKIFPPFKNIDFGVWVGLMAMTPVVKGEPLTQVVPLSDGNSLSLAFPVVVDSDGNGTVTVEVTVVYK